jgi:hypothetical protein
MRITKAKAAPTSIKIKTKPRGDLAGIGTLQQWWLAETPAQLTEELTATAGYLKTNQTFKLRQLAVDVRMYAGLSIYNYAGSSIQRMDRTRTLPDDRPTFNLIQACTDTLVSRLGQNKPQPKFLTDGADYRQRHLAQRLNSFIMCPAAALSAEACGPR